MIKNYYYLILFKMRNLALAISLLLFFFKLYLHLKLHTENII